MFKLLVLCFIGITGVYCAKYPTELPKCGLGDTECLPAVITEVIQKVANNKGYPGLNLPSIDPLHINEINIDQGTESPVNIKLHFENIDLIGLKNAVIYKTRGFEADPKTSKYEIYLKSPQVALIGDYSISGRILVLPIQGEGKCNLTLDNMDISVKWTGKTVTRNGKEYLQTDKFKFVFDTSRLYMNFGNLFKGDKALGDNTNKFLNENWQDILNELKANLFDAFGQVVESLINSVFSKIQYKDLFIN